MIDLSHLGTKEKILSVSEKLFSEFGYQGTSVRDIAKAAEVNVASINYHFGSKERLLNEVLKALKDSLDEKMDKIYQKIGDNFLQLSKELFNIYLGANNNVIKLYTLAMFDKVIDFNLLNGEGGILGPPGSKVLFLSLKSKFKGRKVDDDSFIWGAKTMALNISGISNFLRNYGESLKQICSEEIANSSIERLSSAIILEIEHGIVVKDKDKDKGKE